MNIQQYVYSEKTVNRLRGFQTLSNMAAKERRRTNYQMTLLWYTLNHGLGQIQMSIFLGRWLESCSHLGMPCADVTK